MKVLKGLSMEPLELTQEQQDEYHKNGFLVIKDMFNDEECSEIEKHARGAANEEFSAILNLDREVEELRSVMKAPKVVSVMETLNKGKMVGLMSQMLFKEVGSPYQSQAWEPHQDNSYPRNENGLYITINIALEKQLKENGCLFIYPGSHKGGLYECDYRPSYREEAGSNPGNWIDVSKFDFNPPVDLHMERGDALILHGNVVHGSYPSTSKELNRPLMQYTYINEGEDFIPGRNGGRMAISLDWD